MCGDGEEEGGGALPPSSPPSPPPPFPGKPGTSIKCSLLLLLPLHCTVLLYCATSLSPHSTEFRLDSFVRLQASDRPTVFLSSGLPRLSTGDTWTHNNYYYYTHMYTYIRTYSVIVVIAQSVQAPYDIRFAIILSSIGRKERKEKSLHDNDDDDDTCSVVLFFFRSLPKKVNCLLSIWQNPSSSPFSPTAPKSIASLFLLPPFLKTAGRKGGETGRKKGMREKRKFIARNDSI